MYVEHQLRSGLHPSMLEKDEKNLLVKIKGEEWYKNWGYVKEDLDNIVTLNLENTNNK